MLRQSFYSVMLSLLACLAMGNAVAQSTAPTLLPADTAAAPTANAGPAASEDFKSLDEEVQGLKKEVLDSVTLKFDDKEVANYLYTEREAQALLKGGVHRVFIGNLKAGEHELVALFTGQGPNARDYRRGATIKVEKGVGAKYIELKISDKAVKAQPEFVVKEWE